MRRRHVPMRTCVGCRESFPKNDLTRVVRTPTGEVLMDLTGKVSGRGAYLCLNQACLEKALLTKQLERSLQVKIEPEVFNELKRVLHEQDL